MIIRITKPIALASFLVLLLAVTGFGSIDVPPLKGRVNDYAEMLSAGTEQGITAKLADLELKESTQIAVLTVPSIEDEPMEAFSLRVAEKWEIGQKERDNGAILVIARDERQIRIEVGYGLEGRLTDLISGRIIRNVITPAFRAGNFDSGVADGVTAMIGAVRGEYTAANPARTNGKADHGAFFALFTFALLIIQLGRIRWSVGMLAGGFLLPILSAMFFPLGGLKWLGLIPLGLLSGSVLALIGAGFRAAAGIPHGSSGYHGRGGYWTGGYRGGGGFGGGGFGGFSGGGGGFGGGGASGGW